MNPYTVYLLDDDAVFLSAFEDALRRYLDTLPYDFSVRSFTRCADLAASTETDAPSLIIADIELPDEEQTGIAFLRSLQAKGCAAEIIFLTNHLNYATDVFELRPLYFILKSEYERRIPAAIDFFLQKTQKRRTVLTLNIGGVTELIPTDTIVYCERCGRETTIHCIGKTFTAPAKLNELAQCLPAGIFALSHQSILVNLGFVQRFSKNDIALTNGLSLPISRSHAEDFKAALGMYLSN